MNGPDRQQIFLALLLGVMALFVASGTARDQSWRRWLRRATIVAFVVALLAALLEVTLWLIDRG